MVYLKRITSLERTPDVDGRVADHVARKKKGG